MGDRMIRKKIEIGIDWRKLYMAIGLIMIGVLGRIMLLSYANIETVMVVALLSGCLLGGIYCVFVPVTVMILTDWYIYTYHYNSAFTLNIILGITLFTWSGFVIAGFFGSSLKRKVVCSPTYVGIITGMGVIATLIYDTWTAFGWWYIVYPHTMNNLRLVYTLQIPFTLYHLMSTIIFVPIISIPIIYLWKHAHLISMNDAEPVESAA